MYIERECPFRLASGQVFPFCWCLKPDTIVVEIKRIQSKFMDESATILALRYFSTKSSLRFFPAIFPTNLLAQMDCLLNPSLCGPLSTYDSQWSSARECASVLQ